MLLEVEGLCVNYGRIEAIRDVTFSVEEGSVVTLIGANGAGKTTTLRAVMGSIAARKGRIEFAGEDVTGLSPHEKTARGLVLVPGAGRAVASCPRHQS